MTQPLWRGMKQAKDEGAISDLMGRIEELVTAGQVTELESLIGDLQELILAVQDVLANVQAKKSLMVGQKAGIEQAMAQIRAKVPTSKRKGRKSVAEQIAEKILPELG